MGKGLEQTFLQGYTNCQQGHEKMPSVTGHEGDANQDETALHTQEDGYNQKDKCWEDVEKLEPSYAGAAAMENRSALNKS